ncbi:MAG: prolipoprotein diacylglyceryl transferase [Erysipelotrichaceae bacterium]
MTFFPDFKTFVEIGSITITWYGIIVITAAWICYWLSSRTIKKMGYPSDMLEDFFITMLPIAFIGARLWYVLFELEKYLADPIKIFYIWEGGLAIHGGLIAAVVYGLWFFKRRGISPLRIADAVMPNLLVAQFIGRWGNFMNQEAYGNVVSEAFYNGWPTFIKDHMYIAGEYRQPTFLFEGIGNLIGFFLITVVYKRYGRKKRGDLMFAYIAWYGLVRLYVEGLRTDSLMLGDIRIAQLISLMFILIGILGILGVFDRIFKNTVMFRKQKPVVLFDFDGTLLDSEALIQASFIHTFQIHRPEMVLDEKTLRTFFGPTLKQTFAQYTSDETELDAMIQTYREFNYKNHDEMVSLMDGAFETVVSLHSQGYDLGIVSNKNHALVQHAITFFGMETYFQSIVGVDDVTHAKPNPEGLMKACKAMYRGHDDLIYVGDFASDIKTAKNMAAFSVAFVSDEANREAIEKEKPMVTITHLQALVDLVKENREWSDNSIL